MSEHELTDVHNELYLAIEHIMKLEQQLAQARALLEEVLPDSLPNWEKLIQCSICGCSATQAHKIEHDDHCPIPRISAFLAQHKEQADGK